MINAQVESQAHQNFNNNNSNISTIKTTIVKTKSPDKQENYQPKSKSRTSSAGKTYTKVTIGEGRLVGEKRYIVNADGTQQILDEKYDREQVYDLPGFDAEDNSGGKFKFQGPNVKDYDVLIRKQGQLLDSVKLDMENDKRRFEVGENYYPQYNYVEDRNKNSDQNEEEKSMEIIDIEYELNGQ